MDFWFFISLWQVDLVSLSMSSSSALFDRRDDSWLLRASSSPARLDEPNSLELRAEPALAAGGTCESSGTKGLIDKTFDVEGGCNAEDESNEEDGFPSSKELSTIVFKYSISLKDIYSMGTAVLTLLTLRKFSLESLKPMY